MGTLKALPSTHLLCRVAGKHKAGYIAVQGWSSVTGRGYLVRCMRTGAAEEHVWRGFGSWSVDKASGRVVGLDGMAYFTMWKCWADRGMGILCGYMDSWGCGDEELAFPEEKGS